jgi:hypothetical protein
MNQIPPLGASKAIKIFTNILKMRKLWLSKLRGVKIENDVTLGSPFMNIENISRKLFHCF